MNHFMNVVIKYALVQNTWIWTWISIAAGGVHNAAQFSPILNLIAVAISTERVHAENDILRIFRVMILHDTVLAIFRAARLV